MPRKKERRKHIVLGKDFRSDGHTRITKGEDWVVEGGTKHSHEETSDLVNEFSKRLRKEGHPDAATAAEILRDVLQDRRHRN